MLHKRTKKRKTHRRSYRRMRNHHGGDDISQVPTQQPDKTNNSVFNDVLAGIQKGLSGVVDGVSNFLTPQPNQPTQPTQPPQSGGRRRKRHRKSRRTKRR